MGRVAATRWLFLVATLLPVAPAAASTEVDELLREAEAVRSARPARLVELLVDLDRAAAEATPAQREQLAYLHAYADVYAGRYANALAEARNLVETSSDPDLQLRARALIVTMHGLSRQFTDGLRELEPLHKGLASVREDSTRRQALFASASLYWQVGQYAFALRDLDTLLMRTGTLTDRERCFATQLRQETRQAAGNASDVDELNAIVDQCLAAGEPLVANMARLAMARGIERSGRTAEAISMLREWLPEMEATRYPRFVTEVHSSLAEWLLATGDPAGAQHHASRAVSDVGDGTELLPVTAAHRVLYEVAEASGDARAALHHFRRYAEADKAYLNDVQAREFAYQIVRRETQQQSQQIALLDQQNQVLTLRQQVSEQAARNTQLLIALLLLLLATVAYWGWRVTRSQRSLRVLAEMDSLTGVCNRRHFLLQAEQCLEQCQRAGAPVALVMFDLDRFKLINDSYGHVTGDWVLERVAAECRTMCRRVDLFGRLGGEEFAILLPGCDAEAAGRVAEQCRARIEAVDVSPTGHVFPLAASFGVTCSALSGFTMSRLLSHADQALYRAKHAGRNRVSVYAGEHERSRSPMTPPAGLAPQAR